MTFFFRVLLTYISADFRDMDDMKSSFEDDFKSYNKLMEEVAKKPIVSKCCLMPERKSMLVIRVFHQIFFVKVLVPGLCLYCICEIPYISTAKWIRADTGFKPRAPG